MEAFSGMKKMPDKYLASKNLALFRQQRPNTPKLQEHLVIIIAMIVLKIHQMLDTRLNFSHTNAIHLHNSPER